MEKKQKLETCARGLDEKACETLRPMDDELLLHSVLRHSGTLRIFHLNKTLDLFLPNTTYVYLVFYSFFTLIESSPLAARSLAQHLVQFRRAF